MCNRKGCTDPCRQNTSSGRVVWKPSRAREHQSSTPRPISILRLDPSARFGAPAHYAGSNPTPCTTLPLNVGSDSPPLGRHSLPAPPTSTTFASSHLHNQHRGLPLTLRRQSSRLRVAFQYGRHHLCRRRCRLPLGTRSRLAVLRSAPVKRGYRPALAGNRWICQ